MSHLVVAIANIQKPQKNILSGWQHMARFCLTVGSDRLIQYPHQRFRALEVSNVLTEIGLRCRLLAVFCFPFLVSSSLLLLLLLFLRKRKREPNATPASTQREPNLPLPPPPGLFFRGWCPGLSRSSARALQLTKRNGVWVVLCACRLGFGACPFMPECTGELCHVFLWEIPGVSNPFTSKFKTTFQSEIYKWGRKTW